MEEYDPDDDITGVRCYYFLRMQNFLDNMDEIKENGSKM